ncbi:MAG: type I methionyl aminopeptidase [Candidatus Omnitrophica bacterium]|nr:type I methionyl aminopeptidase [Candidatus Omnitrophota bacterium]
MIPLKTKEQIEMLEKSGMILGRVMKELEKIVAPGTLTCEIDNLAESLITKAGARPAFKGYKGFPASVCTSVNEEIVHGIPGERRLLEGDIVGIDLGVNYRGYFTDAAITVAVGEISSKVQKLIEVSRNSLEEAIKEARAGRRLFDISSRIQNFVEQNGFSVVRQFVGHGIGLALHEEPEIPNFGQPNQGPILKSGMVLAIEPMINLGSWEARIMENGWTAVTQDGLASSHFEHTVLIDDEGPRILTN